MLVEFKFDAPSTKIAVITVLQKFSRQFITIRTGLQHIYRLQNLIYGDVVYGEIHCAAAT